MIILISIRETQQAIEWLGISQVENAKKQSGYRFTSIFKHPDMTSPKIKKKESHITFT